MKAGAQDAERFMKLAIEDSFPIVEINRLAVPERNAFKPIYQMHKWFARRASCVFRAILLGALKPLPVGPDGKPLKSGAQVIMEEFYKDHTHDPDTNGKIILDPFMGGGTTVVEALRLGCRVIGIDLNPVAWFIVKTEIEPVDLDELRAAFNRLTERKVEWSGKPLRETLLDLYKTKCPSCGGEADSIYTFWVKSAVCTDHNCRKQVPLFSDYIVAQKTPSIRYFPDCDCPECGKVFDWEIEPAAMVGDKKLLVNAGKFSAGQGRTSARWAYGRMEKRKVVCPWCSKAMTPKPSLPKTKRKKVELSVLLCPQCESVWQFRGPLADKVQCPSCRHSYDPREGHVPEKGRYLCSCGNRGKIIESIRSLPEADLLPIRPYAIEGYCPVCDGRSTNDEETAGHGDLFEKAGSRRTESIRKGSNPDSLLWKNGGKFFHRIETADLALYQKACGLWEKHKTSLPYPQSKVPLGEKTKSGLIAHHYLYWHQMFNPRQLLALATILDAIRGMKDTAISHMMLSNFQMLIDRNSMFNRYYNDRDIVRGMFSRHDFAPLLMPAETNIMGDVGWGGTWNNLKERLIEGKAFNKSTYDWLPNVGDGKTIIPNKEVIDGKLSSAVCQDSRNLAIYIGHHEVDGVITDPPYADNVNYAELADAFYVWLRLVLKCDYPWYQPEMSPKSMEIVENRTRGISNEQYSKGLEEVFHNAASKLNISGLMVFTFHHREGHAWEGLLRSIMDAGLEVLSVYPIHGDSETSMHLMNRSGAISYDLIHVCRKRFIDSTIAVRSWAGIRKQVRDKARIEIATIEDGRYGNTPLSPMDCNIILIGKCLELYSKHYGKVVDHKGEPVPLHVALEEIRMMVDQLTTEESALPLELEEIDAPSYVYLTCLCDRKEIKSDEVHKATRGITEPATLIDRDLMIKGRAKRGRTYEVKSPLDRLDSLKKKFGARMGHQQGQLFDDELLPAVSPEDQFIDYVHFLIGLAENGESVMEWLDKFRGKRPQIRAALDYLSRRNRAFADPVRKILGLMDEKTLFNSAAKTPGNR